MRCPPRSEKLPSKAAKPPSSTRENRISEPTLSSSDRISRAMVARPAVGSSGRALEARVVARVDIGDVERAFVRELDDGLALGHGVVMALGRHRQVAADRN